MLFPYEVGCMLQPQPRNIKISMNNGISELERTLMIDESNPVFSDEEHEARKGQWLV